MGEHVRTYLAAARAADAEMLRSSSSQPIFQPSKPKKLAFRLDGSTIFLKLCFFIWKGLGGPWGCPGGPLGTPWEGLGDALGGLWGRLGEPSQSLGGPRRSGNDLEGLLGRLRGPLEALGGALGEPLGRLGGLLGASWGSKKGKP